MNKDIHLDSTSDVPLPISHLRTNLSGTSMYPDSQKAAPAALDLTKKATQGGAHDTIDRIADSATSVVQKLGESVSAAEDAMHANAAQLGKTRDHWVEGARCTVCSKPLSSVAAAFALGVMFARITR